MAAPLREQDQGFKLKVKFHLVVPKLLGKLEKGVSQVAKETMLPESTLRDWVTGKSPPTRLDAVYILAKYFDVSIEYLLFGIDTWAYKRGVLELQIERAKGDVLRTLDRVLKE